MATETSAPAELAAPKKNRLKLIVVAVVALLLAAALSAGGTWLFLSKSAPAADGAVVQPVEAARQPAIYEDLAPAFVVNFYTEGRTRYMQASLTLLARDQRELAALKVHMPALRNQLVMLLSSQEFTDLNTPLGVDMLKQRVTAAVQELAMSEVGSPVVEQVLFTNFVMQ